MKMKIHYCLAQAQKARVTKLRPRMMRRRLKILFTKLRQRQPNMGQVRQVKLMLNILHHPQLNTRPLNQVILGIKTTLQFAPYH